jgi:transcriptional regulator with XRE-family HTH domain
LSVPDNPMPHANRSSFERWDLAEPILPRTNLLYRLTPCGLGTPYVESLSSYVTRLAEAHVVSVWRFILHVLSPVRTGRIPRCGTRYAYPVNGLGKDSEIILRALEAATHRSDLRLLTLSALEGVISQPNTFRTPEAWCPGCLEQWRTAGVPVYSPLQWAVRIVTVCPVHSYPLVDRCPHCHSRFARLKARAWLGHCSICAKWLGFGDLPTRKITQDNEQYELWVATAVGQVLATMPDLQQVDLLAALRDNLQRCLNQTEGATKEYLATLAGAAPGAFSAWVSGRIKPTFDHLCHLSYQLKLPLIALFTGVTPGWRGPERLQQAIEARSKFWAQPLIARRELRQILVAVLNENPAPSVAEIARRLRFRRPQTLWSREPGLCRKISARRHDSGMTAGAATQLYKRSESQRLESILRGHLDQESPLSLNEIASRLGYKSSTAIRERFPDVCRAIAAKRKQNFLQNREKMRVALKAARTEVPPPSLKKVARRLGYTAEVVVVKAFPEMCAAHKQWRRAWRAEQRDELGVSIREWVASQLAPTVTSVCLHFGISQAYFQLHLAEENRALVERSAERARLAREARAAAMRKEVFGIIRELQEKNIYPSLPRVRSALSPGLPGRSPLLRTLIGQATLQYGYVLRQRDEFGRFV